MTPRSDDGTLEQAPALKQWTQYVNEATAEVGKPLGYERRIREYLTDAGFVNIQEVTYRLPLNTWPADKYGKTCGRWYEMGFVEGIEGLSLGPLCRVKQWPFPHVQQFIKDVLQQTRSRDVHAYHTAYVFSILGD